LTLRIAKPYKALVIQRDDWAPLMILFTLKCGSNHEFEGWFRDNVAYDRQQRRGLIACPECGSTAVEKAPMAPRLGRSHQGRSESPPPEPQSEAPVPVTQAGDDAPPTPAQVRRALQILRRHIERNCEDVGTGFAAEARRIHKGEAKTRGIYGAATQAETKALLEDGIEVASIPWVPSSDA
jgi:hypothetical protein